MTSTRTATEGGLGISEPSALARLLTIPAAEFADHYWGREALLSSAEELGGDFTDLLDQPAIDQLVSERGLRTPFLRVAKNGTTLADRTFTAPGGVGATIADQVSDDKLLGLFADGSTMVLQALHRVWPPIIAFCQHLAAELGHPVQANAYVTPPQSRGFSDHYDVHDVFVLQLAGEKRWSIHAPVHDSPLRSEPWTDRRAAVEARAAEPALIDATLRPGDCLYLPRGFLHAATALGGVSAHLTIGVHTWTRYGLAERVVQHALRLAGKRADIRASLPPGTDVAESTSVATELQHVRAVLTEALAAVDATSIADELRGEVRRSQRAAPVGPLRQMRAATELTEQTPVRMRPHLAAEVLTTSTGTLIRSRAGDLEVTEDEGSVVRALLVAESVEAGKVGLDLARRLLLAGLAVTG